MNIFDYLNILYIKKKLKIFKMNIFDYLNILYIKKKKN